MRAYASPPAPLPTPPLLFFSQRHAAAPQYQGPLGPQGRGERPALWAHPATAAHLAQEAGQVLEEQNLLFIKQIRMHPPLKLDEVSVSGPALGAEDTKMSKRGLCEGPQRSDPVTNGGSALTGV